MEGDSFCGSFQADVMMLRLFWERGVFCYQLLLSDFIILFDVMVHLIVHLVGEIRLCGPIFLQWMYPVEEYKKMYLVFLRGYNVVTMTQHEVSQAHLYILNNTQEVIPYIHTHKEYLTAIHPKMNMIKVLQEHNRTFINWFKETIMSDDNASKTLR